MEAVQTWWLTTGSRTFLRKREDLPRYRVTPQPVTFPRFSSWTQTDRQL